MNSRTDFSGATAPEFVSLTDFLPDEDEELRQDPNCVMRAFKDAIGFLAKQSGGTLYVPPGVWPIRCSDRKTRFGIHLHSANIRLLGAGMRATTLQLVGGEDCDVVGIGAPSVTVQRLTIAGNMEEPPSKNRPHGIAVRGDPTFVAIRDVVIQSVLGYGIFFKATRDDPGIYANISLHGVIIRNCGDDAIDFKVRQATLSKDNYDAPLLSSPGPRAYLKNIAVDGHSALYPAPNRSSRGENGVDVRGQVFLRNIEVLNVKPGRYGIAGASGVQFREQTGAEAVGFGASYVAEDDHGRGADGSILTNYFISRLPPVPDGHDGRGGGILIAPGAKDRVVVACGNVVDL